MPWIASKTPMMMRRAAANVTPPIAHPETGASLSYCVMAPPSFRWRSASSPGFRPGASRFLHLSSPPSRTGLAQLATVHGRGPEDDRVHDQGDDRPDRPGV